MSREYVVDVIVNGRARTVIAETLTYDEVAALAGLEPKGLTIVYRGGSGAGSLRPGEAVKVADGMVFNTADTSRA